MFSSPFFLGFTSTWLTGQVIALESAPALWSQLATALVVGLLTAVAFQIVLTNLGVAVGLSLWFWRTKGSDRHSDALPETRPQAKEPSRISTLAGMGILSTINGVLFAACFLAARFSQVSTPVTGAITGLVIWSAYFLLVLWLSTQALGSVAGFLIDAATGGVRRLVSAIAQLVQTDDPSPLTADQMADTIRQEVKTALEAIDVRSLVQEQIQAALPQTPLQENAATAGWERLQTYLLESSPKQLTPKRLDRWVRGMVKEMEEISDGQWNGFTLDVARVAQWLGDRDDLTDKQQNRLLAQLEDTWAELQQGNAELSKMQPNQNSNDRSHTVAEQYDELAEQYDELAEQQGVTGAIAQLVQSLPSSQAALSTGSELALTALLLSLPKLQQALAELDLSAIQPSEWAQRLDRALKESQLADLPPALVEPLLAQGKSWRDRARQPLAAMQHTAQEHIHSIQHETQQRLKETRRLAITAAWWLFAIASTGAISAALGGAIAVPGP